MPSADLRGLAQEAGLPSSPAHRAAALLRSGSRSQSVRLPPCIYARSRCIYAVQKYRSQETICGTEGTGGLVAKTDRQAQCSAAKSVYRYGQSHSSRTDVIAKQAAPLAPPHAGMEPVIIGVPHKLSLLSRKQFSSHAAGSSLAGVQLLCDPHQPF